MIARLLRTADFERVLRTRSRASSAHFALHHHAAGAGKLSTGVMPDGDKPVDDLSPETRKAPPGAVWLGAVVPKRHARRAVTRSLLKRQIRAAADDHSAMLSPGCWVVRLRAPIDRAAYPSAASEALRCDVRAELRQLLGRVGAVR